MTLIQNYDAALFDLDGVVYLGPAPVDGAAEGLAGLREAGVRVGFVTNNAARTPRTVVEHLIGLNIEAGIDDVVTSSQAGSRLLADRVAPGAKVLVVGTDALVAEVEAVGLTPVSSVDFLPTLLDLAGLPAPAGPIDGRSLLPLLEGKPFDRGPIFWHYPHYGNQGGAPRAAVRDGDWKLVEWYEDGAVALYTLEDDTAERVDLAASHPEKRAELARELDAWRKDVGARMPTRRDDAR